VVVTQRDDWEDHYRLFESMSCGALILHDVMIAPPKGLVHGQSIIFFKSLMDLQEQALYYLKHDQKRLAVARRGWEWSMRRHRSWHRIEELIFGRSLTDDDNPTDKN
jgi:spore maturation protein CgeB